MKKVFNWERWSFYVIYIPFIFLWIYYCVRSRTFWFFSNVNPSLYFSGYEGETKQEMYGQLPAGYFPLTVYVQPKETLENIILKIKQAGLTFPLAAKPDIGTKGLLFRKIETETQLKHYHSILPFNYVLQQMVTWPLELSIFFVRYPNEKWGKITGIIAKEYLQVKGDGKSSLRDLIAEHPKSFMMAEEQFRRHTDNLETIITKDEIYFLNELGNHNRGATFINLSNEADAKLLKVINNINLYSEYFYYGRYDIKTTSLEDLKEGRNISILEYNGVGSEPNHIYDAGLSYFQAIKVIARHWKDMFKIGQINLKKGIPYLSLNKGLSMAKEAKKRIHLMKKLDLKC